MEGELWQEAYRVVREEGNRQPPRARLKYPDAVIVLVLLWAALHDRPVSWACDGRNWAGCGRGRRPGSLPSAATVSRRLRTVGALGLLGRALARLGDKAPPALVRRVDGKPLPVGGFSKDRDAKWGQAVDHKARGYKLFLVWGAGVVPDAWKLGPMSEAEPVAAAKDLVPKLIGGGYLLGDGIYDSNPTHAACDACGFQLVAPRKDPHAGLGHCPHEPGRLRSIALLETPAPGDLPLTGSRPCPAPFARALYDRRGDIERELVGWCSFGGAASVVQLRLRDAAAAELGPHPAPRRLLVGRKAPDQRPAPVPPAWHRCVTHCPGGRVPRADSGYGASCFRSISTSLVGCWQV
jgi:hypothetical protein